MATEAREPPWQLKGFVKAVLAPGEVREVAIPVQIYRYWDSASGAWRVAQSPLRLAIGRSADDLVWKGEDRFILVD
jgi:beta-glucosidase